MSNRLDIHKALKNPLVKKILPRYVEVAKNKSWANFQIAKRIVVDFDKTLTTAQLWKEHRKLMKTFYETKAVIDKKKLKVEDLEIPRFSLLDLKILLTKEIMKSCELCQLMCHVNRLEEERGNCGVGRFSQINSIFCHMGEEPEISPSLTCFFIGCPSHCVYCQNFMISQNLERGKIILPQQLAKIIEEYNRKVRNINWVGADPVPHLLTVLETLKYCNVNLPSIWNSFMYMSEKTMKLLDGIVDLYLADFRYGDDETAELYSKVKNYWETITRNFTIAFKQAEMLTRILVLPGKWLETDYPKIIKWIKENLGPEARINVMSQYTPHWKAYQYPEISRRLTDEEYEKAIKLANQCGLKNLVK